MKHTPWKPITSRSNYRGGMKVVNSNGHAVATLMITSKAYENRQEMAEAVVLLAAAPDLLEVLRLIIENGEHRFDNNNGWYPTLVVNFYERARAAIAKATNA